ncbi:MAG TPA: AI-2E family transporter, partial [Campylobacteraceae bacterium]|nr:AI-2E family transporter [Campylobacteraceae bacterium]
LYETKIRELALKGSALLSGWGLESDPATLLESFDIRMLVKMGGKTAGNIGLFFSKALLVVIGVGFLLFEAPHFEKKLQIIFKNNRDSLASFQLFGRNIQKYFTIKTLTSLLTGTAITATLLLFDVQYPLLWGFLGFLLNFIPVIGSTIAAIPALILTLLYQEPLQAFWLMVIYLIINNLISNVLEPKLMGEGLGLSPAVIFFSLIFWGWVLGPVGMFLAVPLTMTLKIAFDSSPRTLWIGILLSNLRKRGG